MNSLNEAKAILQQAGYKVYNNGDYLSVTTNSQRPGRRMVRPLEIDQLLDGLAVVAMSDYGRVKVVEAPIPFMGEPCPAADRFDDYGLEARC